MRCRNLKCKMLLLYFPKHVFECRRRCRGASFDSSQVATVQRNFPKHNENRWQRSNPRYILCTLHILCTKSSGKRSVPPQPHHRFVEHTKELRLLSSCATAQYIAKRIMMICVRSFVHVPVQNLWSHSSRSRALSLVKIAFDGLTCQIVTDLQTIRYIRSNIKCEEIIRRVAVSTILTAHSIRWDFPAKCQRIENA